MTLTFIMMILLSMVQTDAASASCRFWLLNTSILFMLVMFMMPVILLFVPVMMLIMMMIMTIMLVIKTTFTMTSPCS